MGGGFIGIYSIINIRTIKWMRASDEEGFYTDHPTLEHVTVSVNASIRPTDFEPRYVSAHGLMRYIPANEDDSRAK